MLPAFGSAVPSLAPVDPACPFCRSARVTTTSKTVTETTYWRCHECGQVWNPSRLVSRPPQRRW